MRTTCKKLEELVSETQRKECEREVNMAWRRLVHLKKFFCYDMLAREYITYIERQAVLKKKRKITKACFVIRYFVIIMFIPKETEKTKLYIKS